MRLIEHTNDTVGFSLSLYVRQATMKSLVFRLRLLRRRRIMHNAQCLITVYVVDMILDCNLL